MSGPYNHETGKYEYTNEDNMIIAVLNEKTVIDKDLIPNNGSNNFSQKVHLNQNYQPYNVNTNHLISRTTYNDNYNNKPKMNLDFRLTCSCEKNHKCILHL